MSGQHIQPAMATGGALEVPSSDASLVEYSGAPEAEAAQKGPNIGRILSALNRFKWMIAAITLAGAGAGYVATLFITPAYEVRATVLLEQGTGTSRDGRGPIQAAEFLKTAGWGDLLTSYVIADPVVTRLGLFVTPANAADSVTFRDFRVDQRRLRPGLFVLTTKSGRYSLALKAGVEVEKGVIGDSIGRTVGFQWQPSARVLALDRRYEFSVVTPREASGALIRRLSMTLNDAFMRLSLTGEDPQRTAATLNEWTEQFIAVAMALKKKNIAYQASILDGQQQYAADQLSAAESALESFRVRTVTEPNERQAIQPGLEMTTAPVVGGFFRDKLLVEAVRRDRESLEGILGRARQGEPITSEAVLSIPSITQDPAAEALRKLMSEQGEREVQLRRLREVFTDEAPQVKSALVSLEQVRSTMVPAALGSYVSQLRIREQQLSADVASSGQDLKGIPKRAIEEQRLKRDVDVNDDLYRSLNLKAAEAKLAEAATIPDVSILDPAVAPLNPTRNTAPVLILGAVAAAFGLGVVLAILLDKLDKRFRYPEQATDDLGLFVLGVVPRVDKAGRRQQADQAAQVVEAFRTIRMNVRYAADPSRPMTLTVTSPGPNDGKSLVSANLALSFAESGARTLLIDGDIRRGELAKTFGIDARPGLVEYLDGTALIAEVLHPVSAHPNLTLLPGGARRRRGPELLATPRLPQLISQMSSEYDVVIVDSPPLGAGFDAYALATATVNMALVLRAGITDRKMAAAKMSIVETLPVRVLGSILNGIKLTGVYEYYSYYQEYAAADEDPTPRLQNPTPREAALPGGRS
jgi:succinoglycan biosynthesis transport protein ExoP